MVRTTVRTFTTAGYVPGIIFSKRLAHTCLARLSLAHSTQLSLEARGGSHSDVQTNKKQRATIILESRQHNLSTKVGAIV